MTNTPEQEIWVAVDGYEGLYEVSSLGRVRSLDHELIERRWGSLRKVVGRMRRIHNPGRGYTGMALSRDNVVTHKKLHTLVAQGFLGPRPSGLEVNHIDGDKSNNRVSNLEYVTQTENNLHAVRLGLPHRGEQCHNTRITDKQALEVRELCEGGQTYASVARRYGVAGAVIRNIAIRKTWKHI